MSVIIKGAKLPEKSEHREYTISIVQDFPAAIMLLRTKTKPSEFFKCAEIPTPHGRLIDADEHIKSLRDGFCGERCRRNHDCFNCGIDGYIRIVENEPTVLEAEVSE